MSAPTVNSPVRTFAIAALAAIVLNLALIQPNHPDAVAWNALLLFPLELPVILLALLAIGDRRTGRLLRVVLVALLTLIAALKAADFGMFSALSRSFNPVSDLPLIASFYALVEGAMGRFAATAALIMSVLALLVLSAALWWATGIWSRLDRPRWVATIAGVAAILMWVVVVADVGEKRRYWALPVDLYGTAFTARVGLERAETAYRTLAELRAFRVAVKDDPFAEQDGLFDLVDRDVIVVFVESYGRTSLDTPFYADLHRATLESAEKQLADLGLATASTILESPTRGGQSWLAHSSFANGLWINNQVSYGAALTSGRQTLYHLAARSGFHTAAVMPQITLDWPEAQFMGFETILASKDLGYRGKAFNWITMPDQFTFAAMDRLLPRGKPGRPLFIQMALGSSHAPWVPVPDLIDWDALGDGTIFNPIVERSDPPHIVWKDNDRVRAQYRLAVDYALQTVFSYAALHADEPPLMIVMGDHQAAGFIALDERPDVPMHLIGPKPLLDAIADHRFYPGLMPPDSAAPMAMSDMRGHILRALSTADIAEAVQ